MGFNRQEKAKILEAIPSTEACSFGDFCNDYPDTPAKGERSEWAGLFGRLAVIKNEDLVEITYEEQRLATPKRNPNIESLQLTEAGAQWVRDFRKVHFSE